MLQISSRFPNLRLTFNIVPSLIDQLNDYVEGRAYDYSWHLSKKDAQKLTDVDKEFILTHFFKGKNEAIIYPFPRYKELYEKKVWHEMNMSSISEIIPHFSTQEYLDLQVWHNLAWVGPISSKNKKVQELVKKGKDFSEKNKETLFAYLEILHKSVFQIYIDQLNKNHIEISTSPYYNSILPLVMDNHSVRLRNEEYTLPINRFQGKKYIRQQLLSARKSSKKFFDRTSVGLVPRKIAVDDKSLNMIARLRFDWTLLHSSQLPFEFEELDYLFPVNFSTNDKHDVVCFIKNTPLVRYIEKNLAGLPANEAVDELFNVFEHYRKKVVNSKLSLDDAILVLPLDCSFLYEFKNHVDFLDELYRRLDNSKQFETITPKMYLDKKKRVYPRIKNISSHSQFAYFDNWIGSNSANRAWEMISKTDEFIKTIEERGEISEHLLNKARKNFQIALAPEWFEWYSNAETRWDVYYDELFRSRLIRIYELLNEKPPKTFFYNLKNDSSSSFRSVPVTRHIHPTIDGYENLSGEWVGAAIYDAAKHRIEIGNHTKEYLKYLKVGYNQDNLYFAMTFFDYPPINVQFVIDFLHPENFSLHIFPLQEIAWLEKIDDSGPRLIDHNIEFSMKDILEIRMPVKQLNLKTKQIFSIQFCILQKDNCLERFPQTSVIRTRFMEEEDE
jgi:alpha-amylase/alpha-mannosidase (GH57 family)